MLFGSDRNRMLNVDFFCLLVKDTNLQQEWLKKIWRDVGLHLKLTEATKVCSLHFNPRDMKKGIGVKKLLYVK